MAAVALTGCGGDGGGESGRATLVPATVVEPTTSSTAPTTTTTQPEDEAALADGRHPAFVKGVDVAKRLLTIDVVQWLEGDAANKAYEQETGDSSGAPNDYYIVNANPRLRTLPVAPELKVTLVRLQEDASADSDPGTFEELPAYLPKVAPTTPFWITVRAGTVVGIDEQYVP